VSTGTVRDAAFEVLRRTGMTTIFGNPGSTEIPLLAGLPEDLRFVLALHEGSVVGMATGWALAGRGPALTVLHTTAGLGNAVSAIATARVNRAPLVVLVGQQDRRHLALEPFLAGRLHGLAGEYPVWTDQPVRAQDVPGAIARAAHEAVTGRGPAIVIVPMDDWSAPWDGTVEAAPAAVLRPAAVADEEIAPLAALLAQAEDPVLVAGAGADSPAGWAALTELAERLGCPVWQEAFGARAGFPQDHPQFAGVLPADRGGQRRALKGHDVVLAVGAPVFRHYPYDPGPLVEPGTRIAVVSDDPAEVHRSPAELAVLADPAAVCARLARLIPAARRRREVAGPDRRAVPPPAPGAPLRAVHVLQELARRLPPETVVIEEAPSSRADLHRLLPARRPLGFLSAAMGGLGFALPAVAGLRMALPERPVVAVVGDGSAIYGIQALWSAAHFRIGALIVVLANGRYAIMDRLAERHAGGPGAARVPWPAFPEVSLSAMARSFGCPAIRIDTHDRLVAVLDEIVPDLASRTEPLLLDIGVAPDAEFHP